MLIAVQEQNEELLVFNPTLNYLYLAALNANRGTA
jgi:hypothetical protein